MLQKAASHSLAPALHECMLQHACGKSMGCNLYRNRRGLTLQQNDSMTQKAATGDVCTPRYRARQAFCTLAGLPFILGA